MPTSGQWTVQLSVQARRDYTTILAWTDEHFGPRQMQTYSAVLKAGLRFLRDGPEQIGVRKHPDILASLYSVHVSRSGRPGRHQIFFQCDDQRIRVMRILHDAMDPKRHLT